MTNLFLVPVGETRARENFERTIRRRLPPETLDELSPGARRLARARRGGVRAWGSKAGKDNANVSTWSSMAPGDWVLFYLDGLFSVCGRVVVREHSPAVADRLWGSAGGETWEYMYLLDEIRQVDIPRLAAWEKLGYRPGFHLRGFTRVDRDLDAEYESVANLIGELAGVGQDFHAAIGTAMAGDESAAVLAVDQLDQMSERELLASLAGFLASEPPAVRREVVKRIQRNRRLVRALKRLYEGRCQVCDFSIEKSGGGNYCEAAHIEPISLRRADLDVKDNIVILCPNHHKMLDHGAMSIEFDSKRKALSAVVGGRRERMRNLHVGL